MTRSETFRGDKNAKDPTLARKVRIPIYSGRVFRREAGHRSDLKPSTIPK